MPTYDYTIIGGGIVGLSTAMALGQRLPKAKILVLDKELELAAHQTGHNSGVIHSGIYYKPGSLKARLAREGSRVMVEFCREHGIAHDVCGKVIVATQRAELPLMENLYKRGLENGLNVARLTPEAVREIEPAVVCLGGIHVPSAGIVDYKQVCLAMARLVQGQGGAIELGRRVLRIQPDGTGTVLETSGGERRTRFVINCAGLHSDRVARLDGVDPGARIVPFRGEYYELIPEKRSLVRNLIYPVPDPAFPFLGVHFTRTVRGSIHAGPNAVLGLKREGYKKTDVDWDDLEEILLFKGFWKLAARHWRPGLDEVIRSFSKAAFVRSMRQIIPAIQSEDVAPSPSGVRAQALGDNGALVDDFLILPTARAVHVCNAPSPAATASIEIGREIVRHVPESAMQHSGY